MCIIFQVSSGAAIAGNMPGGHVSNRPVPRPMNVGMQRMHQLQAYNLPSQQGMGSGINPAGIPMQRGVSQQAHQQQQVYCLLGKGGICYPVVLFYGWCNMLLTVFYFVFWQLRRKDQMGMPGYPPQQKPRRMWGK